MSEQLNRIESIRLAAHAATLAHKKQTRKNGRTPYIVHPATVAQLVLFYDNSCYLGAIAAWMHDILEDCGTQGEHAFFAALMDMPLSESEIYRVRRAVYALTKNNIIPNRAAKWDDSLSRLVADDTPPFTILVKICDRMDNLMDMDEFKPGFEKLYIEETDLLISAIRTKLLSNTERRALGDLQELRDLIVKRDNI